MGDFLSKDRHNKWAMAMMLPEHVKLLKEYNQSLSNVEKPILEEDKLNEINDCIRISLEEYTPVLLSIYNNGRINEHEYYVNGYDQLNRKLECTKDGMGVSIKIRDIIDAKLI